MPFYTVEWSELKQYCFAMIAPSQTIAATAHVHVSYSPDFSPANHVTMSYHVQIQIAYTEFGPCFVAASWSTPEPDTELSQTNKLAMRLFT